MSKNEHARLQKIWRTVRSETQTCFNPNCNKPAIRSHFHQKRGPLSRIANNGKVYQLQYINFFSNQNYMFREAGIFDPGNDILTFWGFCNECDSKIFAPIEQAIVDNYNYYNQLLYAYRAAAQEQYKVDYMLRFYDAVRRDPLISRAQKTAYLQRKLGYFAKSKGMQFLRRKMEEEIFGERKSRSFRFKTIKLPPVDICSCDIYSGMKLYSITAEDLYALDPNSDSFSMLPDCIFFNLVPSSDATYYITGHYKKAFPFGWIDLLRNSFISKERILKEISDVLITKVESWCMSHSAYQKLNAVGGVEKLLAIKNDRVSVRFTDMQELIRIKKAKVDYNLFYELL